jgi:hypothetical protein
MAISMLSCYLSSIINLMISIIYIDKSSTLIYIYIVYQHYSTLVLSIISISIYVCNIIFTLSFYGPPFLTPGQQER